MTDGPVALVEDLDYYTQMWNTIADYAVIKLDGEGLIRSWHTGAEHLTGYTAAEIIGQPAAVFYPAADAAAGLAGADLRAAAEAGTYATEGWRLRKDGTLYWASVALTAVSGRAGSAGGFGMIIHDLTVVREKALTLRGPGAAGQQHRRHPGDPG